MFWRKTISQNKFFRSCAPTLIYYFNFFCVFDCHYPQVCLLLINLRPSAMIKVFERIVYEKLYVFFGKEKLLNSKQFEFITGYSTHNAPVELPEIIRFNDKSKFTFILLDLGKAFDTTDHSILIRKLEISGACGACFKWSFSLFWMPESSPYKYKVLKKI